jgi:hypothetical protein
MPPSNPRSYLSRRLWLFDNRIVTSPQLDVTGAHRLRAILLGNFWSDGYDGAKVTAEAEVVLKKAKLEAEKCGLALHTWIIWNNVRSACETGQQSTYHLGDAEVKVLKSGQVLTFRDKYGEFTASLAQPKP